MVYDVRGPRLRNITSTYTVPRDLRLPARVDAASPLMEGLLGPEWYPADSGVRWMARRATLRMGAGRKLYLRGICPDEQLRAGPLTVSVTAGGVALPAQQLVKGGSFELAFDLPDALAGRPEMEITVEVDSRHPSGKRSARFRPGLRRLRGEVRHALVHHFANTTPYSEATAP